MQKHNEIQYFIAIPGSFDSYKRQVSNSVKIVLILFFLFHHKVCDVHKIGHESEGSGDRYTHFKCSQKSNRHQVKQHTGIIAMFLTLTLATTLATTLRRHLVLTQYVAGAGGEDAQEKDKVKAQFKEALAQAGDTNN